MRASLPRFAERQDPFDDMTGISVIVLHRRFKNVDRHRRSSIVTARRG